MANFKTGNIAFDGKFSAKKFHQARFITYLYFFQVSTHVNRCEPMISFLHYDKREIPLLG